MRLISHSLPRLIHNRFVKTPLITDTLQLQIFQKGQWVELSWLSPQKSRYHGMNERGNVIAFHYPRAGVQFNAYCQPSPARRKEIMKVRG